MQRRKIGRGTRQPSPSARSEASSLSNVLCKSTLATVAITLSAALHATFLRKQISECKADLEESRATVSACESGNALDLQGRTSENRHFSNPGSEDATCQEQLLRCESLLRQSDSRCNTNDNGEWTQAADSFPMPDEVPTPEVKVVETTIFPASENPTSDRTKGHEEL